MNEKSVRSQRVEKEIFHRLALYLQHELPEPIEALVSVSAVEASPDLRSAGVYFRIVGSQEAFEEASDVLKRSQKAMQHEVARSLNIKFAPVLRFYFGHAAEEDELDRMLAKLKK